jgi:amino acid transporter/nucleotide-binding universal stress UspA family protein
MTKGRLGALLCWGVVFADIGTSVYYTPGILFNTEGTRAALFVLLTGIAFIFLAEKYADIASRYREGGGVVAVAGHAFGDYAGAIGGMLISVDYFLTTAISSVSGLQYLDSVIPLGSALIPAVIACLIALAVLNGVGIRESASVTMVIAVAALAVDLVVIVVVAVQLSAHDWKLIWDALFDVRDLGWKRGLVGFAGAWLAFSGLESISQISPAMRLPREKTARSAMILVVGAILVTSPILTAFSTVLERVDKEHAERFISELGVAYGALPLKVSVVITGSVLLLFAANTAIIGGYHVFRALARQRFLPEVLNRLSPRFGTPHIAIGVAVIIPIAIIIITAGDMEVLGNMYAFGLLGAFTLSSAGLDVVRWRDKQRGPRFYIGLVTTLIVTVAWATNLVSKPLATAFGGGFTVLGMLLATGVRRGWFSKISIPIPYLSRRLAEQRAAEHPHAAKILTLDEALELAVVYSPRTLLCLRGGPNEGLMAKTAERLRESSEQQLYVLFVEEIPGLFFPADISPSEEANAVLARAVDFMQEREITAVPVWRVGHSASSVIAEAAIELKVKNVVIGTSRRTPLWKLLRGSVLRDLSTGLPEGTQLVIVR